MCTALVRTAFGCALLLLACGNEPAGDGTAPEPSPPAEPIQLAQAESWALANATDDPFAQFASDRLRCDSAAVQPEGTWVEVSTLSCNYATLVFTFAAPAPAGSVVRGEVAWSTLAAIDPAVATLAFALPERELWTYEVPIPGQANLVTVEFSLPQAMSAGDTLYFHVRNHGYNSWQLSPLTLLAPR
jgi:hypothetical protein